MSKKSRSFQSDYEKTAYHEAGHATVAWVQGIGVRRVSLPDRICEYGPVPDQFQEFPTTTAENHRLNRIAAEDWVRGYAGLAAEAVYTGQDPRKKVATSQDEAFIANSVTACVDVDDPEAVWSLIEKAWKRSIRILRKNWWAVEAVAEALLREQELDHRGFLSVISSKDPSEPSHPSKQTTDTPAASRPRSCTQSQLKKVGVLLLDEETCKLQCSTCGQQWHPTLLKGSNKPPRYYICPRGCNVSSSNEGA